LCEVGGTFIVVAPTPESAAPTPRTDDGLPPPSQYRPAPSGAMTTTMTGAPAPAAAGGGDDASVASSLATPRDQWDDLHADVLRREFPYASCQQNVTNTTKVRTCAPRKA